jgi:hypothetical protein
MNKIINSMRTRGLLLYLQIGLGLSVTANVEPLTTAVPAAPCGGV